MLGACVQVGEASRGPSYINICFNTLFHAISASHIHIFTFSWQVGVTKCFMDTSGLFWRLWVPRVHICGSFYGRMYVLFTALTYLFPLQLGNSHLRPSARLQPTNGHNLNTALHAQPSVAILLLFSTTPINFGWEKRYPVWLINEIKVAPCCLLYGHGEQYC